jgi:hypothetical protein
MPHRDLELHQVPALADLVDLEPQAAPVLKREQAALVPHRDLEPHQVPALVGLVGLAALERVAAAAVAALQAQMRTDLTLRARPHLAASLVAVRVEAEVSLQAPRLLAVGPVPLGHKLVVPYLGEMILLRVPVLSGGAFLF